MPSRRQREQDREFDFVAKHYEGPAFAEIGIPSAENNQSETAQPDSDLTTKEDEQLANDSRALKVPTSEQDIEKSFGVGLKAEIQEVSSNLTELRAMPLSQMKAKLAKQYDLEAKELIDKLADSHESAITSFLNKMHKAAVAGMNRLAGVPKEMRAECQRIQIEWNREVRRKEDEARRKREAEMKAEQERQRAEEVAHLKAQEKPEAAAELAAAPLPPISSPAPLKPAGKIEGVTLIEVLKIDPDDPFDEPVKFWTWFAEHPECWPFVELKPGDWKRYLTANKGTITPPGLKIVAATETRTRE